jgi:hypothetical protein
MTLDKEEHRAILLELIEKAAFPGAAARKVVELQEAIESADIKEDAED